MPPTSDDKRGALVALGITAGVSLLGFGLVAGAFQDPDTPITPENQNQQLGRVQAFEAEHGDVPDPGAGRAGATPGCGADDLKVNLRVRSKDDLTQAKVQVTNPCPLQVTWQTPSLCLSSQVVVTGPDGSSTPVPVMCAQMLKDWTLEPTKLVDQQFDLPNLGPGEHAVSVTLDGTGLVATQSIVIAPAP